MASAVGAGALIKVLFPATIAGAGYAMTREKTRELLREFATGPGRYSRLALVFFLLMNWKSLPFMWTIRIWRAMLWNLFVQHRPPLPSRTLFHYSISTSYTSIFETDYNLHKSNSTYFADLDVSRTHLVSMLLQPGLIAVGDNKKTRLVTDPTRGEPARGKLGVMLGAVFSSFRKEIPPHRNFEMWSRVLAWDRKWLYIVTHFVAPGTKPTGWDWTGRRWGKTRKRIEVYEDDPEWEKRIFATCISKYVFKIGRLTVNPAVVIQASGLLPDRPGGWTGGESGTGTPVEINGDVVIPGRTGSAAADAEWDWRHVEKMRRKGMQFAEHFAALDGLHETFDAGEDGALGHFFMG